MNTRAHSQSHAAPAPAGILHSLLYVVFFVSGAAGLTYEVLWLRDLERLFGATSLAAATNLSIFFLGLSAGGFVWGRRVSLTVNPLRTYALLEAGVAFTALLYFGLLDLYRGIYGRLFAVLGEQPSVFLLVKVLLAAGILFLPAFFMGGTLPVMAQYMVRRRDRLGQQVSLLYTVNTMGAASGAFMAGFYLPPLLGYRGSYMVGIALSLLVGAIAYACSLLESRHGIEVEREAPPADISAGDIPAGEIRPAMIWAAAAFSGFAALGLEVLWTRMFAQVLQNSVYTFAAILVVFLVALALGAALANLLCRLRLAPAGVLSALLMLSGVSVALTPFLFIYLTDSLAPLGAGLGWTAYIRAVFTLNGAVILLPGAIMGSVFPYLMKLSEHWRSGAGWTVGRLASVNTFAAILGSLAAGFLLLELLGLWRSMALLAAGYLILAVLVLPAGFPGRSLRVLGTLVALVFVAGVFAFVQLPVVYLDPAHDEKLVAVREGNQGTIAVTLRDSGLGIKINNSYVLGTSKSEINLRLQSWLPLALHPHPRSVFYLGMGTGITAGGALDWPVEKVVVSELNSQVVAASRAHFGPYVNGLYEDPRVRIVMEDGRTYLYGSPELYDLIIADIFLTYKAGVGNLYTREHFETVRSRLAPGGMFIQWLTLFDLSRDELGIITRTMLDVFPQVTLWRRGFSPRFPIFALVGSMEVEPLQAEEFMTRLQGLAARGAASPDLWLLNIPLAAYAGHPGAMAAEFAKYDVSTDDGTPLEYLAPITERNYKGAGHEQGLAGLAMADYSRYLLEQVPADADPFLAGVPEQLRRQVPAGLAFQNYEIYRRLGQTQDAAEQLRTYQGLMEPVGD